MQTILHLACSPRGSDAFSRRISDALTGRILARHPAARVVVRDLAANPPALVDDGFSAAILGGAGREDAALAASETLIEELAAASAVVIATPMHNYAVPAVLKAWIDQIVRIRRTFDPTPAGKVGMLPDRPVFLVVASGGWFTGPTPTGAPAQPDFLTPYVRAILATIGIRSLHVITLEGVTRAAAVADRAMALARQEIDRLERDGHLP